MVASVLVVACQWGGPVVASTVVELVSVVGCYCYITHIMPHAECVCVLHAHLLLHMHPIPLIMALHQLPLQLPGPSAEQSSPVGAALPTSAPTATLLPPPLCSCREGGVRDMHAGGSGGGSDGSQQGRGGNSHRHRAAQTTTGHRCPAA